MDYGHKVCHMSGHYTRLNKGLEANLATAEESDRKTNDVPEEALFAVDGNVCAPLPADFSLGSLMGTEPKMLDKALCTPHTKEWQAMYDYEISQLVKLSTWDII